MSRYLVIALWSMAHGFADLLVAGQFRTGGFDSPQAAVDAVLPGMIRRQFGTSHPEDPTL